MKFSISIISHGNGHLISNLLEDLNRHWPEDAELILTINYPEDETYLEKAGKLPVTVLRNLRPMGFGANHNQAFAVANGDQFIVMNPDIRLRESPWSALTAVAKDSVGACAPTVVNSRGTLEDSVRRYPSIFRLFRRVVMNQRSPDYLAAGPNENPVPVEWTAGMFVMFDSVSFREIHGFDTRYFMYLEDVDICKRLNDAGKCVLWVSSCTVVHDAQRASRRSWLHRRWHIRSTIRFLTGL